MTVRNVSMRDMFPYIDDVITVGGCKREERRGGSARNIK